MGLIYFAEGASVEQGPYYDETQDDEVEDLYQLLSQVKVGFLPPFSCIL
jgi:hypothetical protein